MGVPVAPVQVTPKPGPRTSEFWLAIFGNLAAVLIVLWPGHDFTQFVQIAAIATAGGVNAFYAHSRGKVKATH